jgi:polysaccharide biosynthesis protein PslJ
VTASLVHPGDLEPSLVEERTYVTRRRFTRIDIAAILSILLLLLDLLPSRLVVPNLTAVGRPSLLLAFLLWCWWILVRLNPRLVMVGPQPMRWFVLLYVLSILISYAVGALRGLTTMEINGADRAVLATAEFVGVILATADGIPNWDRLRGVLRVWIWCSAGMAIIGIVQFVLRKDITQYMKFPGLTIQGAGLAGLEARGDDGLFRVASTATHYIEFSAVMALALPFGIHFARFDANPKRRRRLIVAALLIALAIPMTLSRTGIMALVLEILVMLPAWNWRVRYNLLGFAGGLVCMLAAVKPGLIGTIKSLFLGASEDPSVTGRTERYTIVWHYFIQRPWLGRGTGTWIPPMYIYLDNQWLGTLLAGGLLGVATLATLHIASISLAGISLKRSVSPEDRHLCVALIATQLSAMLVEGTFDAFAFTTYATTLSFLMGCCAVVWRFTHPARAVRTSVPLFYSAK